MFDCIMVALIISGSLLFLFGFSKSILWFGSLSEDQVKRVTNKGLIISVLLFIVIIILLIIIV
jgi:hypothetical protein